MVQVWFTIVDTRFYAASRRGLEGDWLQNALHDGSLEVRVARNSWRGAASLVAHDDVPHVINAFAEKYHEHPQVIDAWRQDPPTFVQADLA